MSGRRGSLFDHACSDDDDHDEEYVSDRDEGEGLPDLDDPYAPFQESAALQRQRRLDRHRQHERLESGQPGGGVSPSLAYPDSNASPRVGASPQVAEEVFVHSPVRRSAASNKRCLLQKMWVCIQSGIHSEKALEECVDLHGHSVAPGRLFTRATPWKVNPRQRVMTFRCCYSGCPAMLRATQILSGHATYSLSISTNETETTRLATLTAIGHNSHVERHIPSISIPGEIRALLNHDRLKMAPSRLRSAIRGLTLSDGFKVKALLDAKTAAGRRLRKGLVRLHKENFAKARSLYMTEGTGNSFGGLSSILEKLAKPYLCQNNLFNENTVYLLGEALVVPEAHRVTFALSTENLLLNAYRQSCFGLPPMLAVDTTHRLMIASNYCCMLVGTMDVVQHFHIVAYAICSHEDADAHEYVFREVFKAVDSVAADRALSQTRV